MDTHIHIPTTSSSPTTTFVQADKTTFRHLVQKLTGLDGDFSPKPSIRIHKPSSFPPHPTAPRRSTFKLQERRHNIRKLELNLGRLASLDQSLVVSPRLVHMLECSLSLSSPVTPLGTELTLSPASSTSEEEEEEEERAIVEKGFYLHPSPLSTPSGDHPPELLSLFPLSSLPTQSN